MRTKTSTICALALAGTLALAAGCGGDNQGSPAPSEPRAPRVGKPIQLQGTPIDLVASGDSIWALTVSRDDAVVRIDRRESAIAPKRMRLGSGSGCACAAGPSSIALTGKTLWVADRLMNMVTPIDASSGKRIGRRIMVAPPGSAGHRVDPITLAVADGNLWAAHAHFDTLWRIDLRSRKAEGPTSVGDRPFGVAVGEGYAWVTNAADGTVTRVDPVSRKVVGPPIRVGAGPTAVAVADGVAWVTNFDGDTVTRIDAASGTVIGEPIETGDEPSDVVVAGGLIWVAHGRDQTVVRLDPDTGKLIGKPISSSVRPQVLVADEDGAVWVAHSDGTVVRIEP